MRLVANAYMYLEEWPRALGLCAKPNFLHIVGLDRGRHLGLPSGPIGRGQSDASKHRITITWCSNIWG
jgi:hypothetical protein